MSEVDDILPAQPSENNSAIIMPEKIEMLKVGLLGTVSGVVVPFIAWLVQKFLLAPIFCRAAASSGVCSPNDMTAYYIAVVIVAAIVVSQMANWQVFRPLLVVAATASALWGLQGFTMDTIAHAGWEYYMSSALIYAAALLLFYWLLRLRSFAGSVILSVIAVVLIRWALLA